ncbi:hypothetical protein TorRG33x02_061580 [Trema orientale]|uniref:Uncharacterized protein n=1 Tax=Trema orientale TaxID=63057 RepID=A0A2P5FJX9_TREOI|nr:hypothetical protein TorRG33x02_061580 [Trema orientale]
MYVLVRHVTHLHTRHLARAPLHVHHPRVLEHDVPIEPAARPSPRLYPEAVLGARKRRCLDGYVLDTGLLEVPAEFADANTVSVSACDVFDPEVFGAAANGDAVVADSDLRVKDGEVLGELDMDVVGVGAVARGNDLYAYVSTVVDDDVALVAVEGCESYDLDVF